MESKQSTKLSRILLTVSRVLSTLSTTSSTKPSTTSYHKVDKQEGGQQCNHRSLLGPHKRIKKYKVLLQIALLGLIIWLFVIGGETKAPERQNGSAQIISLSTDNVPIQAKNLSRNQSQNHTQQQKRLQKIRMHNILRDMPNSLTIKTTSANSSNDSSQSLPSKAVMRNDKNTLVRQWESEFKGM